MKEKNRGILITTMGQRLFPFQDRQGYEAEEKEVPNPGRLGKNQYWENFTGNSRSEKKEIFNRKGI